MGPMAQDLYAAFGLGDDDRHVTSIDEAGVAFAAIQGLYNQVLQADEKISGLSSRAAWLESANAAANQRVASLEKANGEANLRVASLEKRLEAIEAQLGLRK